MSQSNKATFFLSTGRCGTQWLQKTLSTVYRAEARVTHEPVKAPYKARRYLRAYDKFDELLSSRPVTQHLQGIDETLKTKIYIETGWPSYPVLPFIIDQLEGRVRVVHLVRHPVLTALSLATHKMYNHHLDWAKGFAINPFDPGVIQKELTAQWHTMNMYEKCLFWWTEINLYALELQEKYPDLEFFFLRYEDLFGENIEVMSALVAFMGLAYNPAIHLHTSKIVDSYRYKSSAVDWTLIYSYPKTIALA